MKKIVYSFLISTFLATSLIAAPQAVVFDFGGVLVAEPDRESVITFIQESFQFSKEEFEKANEKRYQDGMQDHSDVEFWISYAKARGASLSSNWVESFKAVMRRAIKVDTAMYELIAQLKEKQIPVALLSNVDERIAKFLYEFGLYEPFNPCLLSCEIGIEKPDLKAYEFLLEKLNLPATDVIFIDDRIENIEAAKVLGLDAILFESEPQLRRELIQRKVLE